MSIRECAVAGTFYSEDKERLYQEVKAHITNATKMSEIAKILITPHAGHIYSGESAGYVYKQLENRPEIERVLLIGPSHHIGFEGFAFSSDAVWQTPLGQIALDVEGINQFLALKKVNAFVHPQPHQYEHSLEVQLPFLQVALHSFTLIPIVYGQSNSDDLLKIVEHFIDEKTIVVMSSDLSHFYEEKRANQLDAYCTKAITRLDLDAFDQCEACGKLGMQAAVKYALRHNLNSKLLSYTTSAKTSGDTNRVVGYGSYMFY